MIWLLVAYLVFCAVYAIRHMMWVLSTSSMQDLLGPPMEMYGAERVFLFVLVPLFFTILLMSPVLTPYKLWQELFAK